MPDDIESIRAAQGGDRNAFTALVKRYQGAVCAVTYALTGRFGLSEDVAQETFVLAWRRLNEVRRPEQFRAWLMTVARRASLRALRDDVTATPETRQSHDVDEFPSPEPSPLDRAISHEEEQLVWAALQRIPPAHRLPIILFYREAHSVEEVARMLGVSEQTAKKRLSRGRRMLEGHVLYLVESILSRTRPTRAFTAATIAALLGAGAKPATAACPPARIFFLRAALAIALPVAVTGADHTGHGAQSSSRASARQGPDAIQPPRATAPPRLVPGALRSSSPSAREDERTSVLAFDFEDGILPESFRLGYLVPGPPRTGNRYSVMGTVLTWTNWQDSNQTGVTLDTGDVTYRDTLVVTFDYWTADDGESIDLEIWNEDRRSNYHRTIEAPVHERWAHAAFRVSSFVPAKACGAMEPGDRLVTLTVYGGPIGGKPFFIDNVRVMDDRTNRLAAADGAEI